jgi:general secretion pathway protein H
MALDLVLAMALIALAAAVAWPLVARGTGAPRLNALVTEMATLLRQDRTRALRTGREVVAILDLGRRTLASGGAGTIAVPADVGLEVLSSGLCTVSARRFAILFRPDGTSCGAVVRIGREATRYTLRVNWLTGAIGVTLD